MKFRSLLHAARRGVAACHLPKVFSLAAAIFLLSLGAAGAQAQEPEEPAEAAEESTVETGNGGPKISIHGFLSQAYAQSDGHQFLGITEDGTADYRTAAVQIRADVSQRDAFAVQFSHERFGASPIHSQLDDVELDWIFYEHRFGEATAVKVGKVQMPFGIYNEVRDVGTLLPFYRPSHNFYADGAFGTETVDGVVVSHRFQLGAWALAADVHAGNWEFLTRTPTGGFAARPVNDSLGAQLWLETPLPGLRLGAGVLDFQVAGTAAAPAEQDWSSLYYSLDAQFGRVILQAEYRTVDVFTGDVDGGYARLGVELTEKITLNGQIDSLDLEAPTLGDRDLDDDQALGINYAFDPSRVLKAEHHWNETSFWAEDVVPAILGPTVKTKYWLVSFATSF